MFIARFGAAVLYLYQVRTNPIPVRIGIEDAPVNRIRSELDQRQHGNGQRPGRVLDSALVESHEPALGWLVENALTRSEADKRI
jgi:hypothetical protein